MGRVAVGEGKRDPVGAGRVAVVVGVGNRDPVGEGR